MTERHASLFRNGRNQAVRIPREFELEGNEVLVRKEGERLILTPIRTRSGDANIDCKVDARDIATVIEFWGSQYELTEMPGDLNGDLVVNGYDLAMVLGDWGDEPQDAKRK